MKIRMNYNTAGLKRGSEVEVADKRGKQLVANGHAVEVKPEPEDEPKRK